MLFMTRITFDIIFCALIALFASVWQLIGYKGLDPWFVPYVAFICWLSLAAGRLLSYWGRRSPSTPLTDLFDFVGGSFLIQLVLFLTAYILHINVVTILCVVSVIIVCSYAIFHKQILPESYNSHQSAQALAILLLILVAVSFWSQQALIQYVLKDGTLYFQSFIDFYIHTGQFLPFSHGDYTQGNFFFSGENIYFYHYGSYMFPAAAAGLGIESALDLITSFWLPFGVLLMALSAFGLGREFGGFGAGLGAVIAILLVPDPSAYLFNNSYFSFHEWIQLSVGCAYGLALIAYSLIWLLHYKKENDRRHLLIALISLISLLFFRAQFLPLFMGITIIWIIFFASNLHLKYRAAFIVAGLAIVVLRPWIVSHLMCAPSLAGPPGGATFIPAALSSRLGASYFGLAEMVLKSDYQWIMISGGLMLITISILGAYLFLTLGLFVFKMIRGRLVLYWDSLPWIALICFCLLAWFLPVSERTHPDEITHRSFMVVYFLFAVWVGSQLFRNLRFEKSRAINNGMIILLIVGGLITPWRLGHKINGNSSSHMPMQKGIYEAALFLQKNAKLGDVFVDTGFNYYGTIGVIALSEAKAFFAPSIASVIERERPQYINRLQRRLDFREKLNITTSAAEAGRMADEQGIRWAIIQDGHRSAWEDDALKAKVFESHNTRVYDLHRLLDTKGST